MLLLLGKMLKNKPFCAKSKKYLGTHSNLPQLFENNLFHCPSYRVVRLGHRRQRQDRPRRRQYPEGPPPPPICRRSHVLLIDKCGKREWLFFWSSLLSRSEVASSLTSMEEKSILLYTHLSSSPPLSLPSSGLQSGVGDFFFDACIVVCGPFKGGRGSFAFFALPEYI